MIAERYAICLNTVFCVGFYAPIMPLSIPLGLIALFNQYWVDKYNLLYHKISLYNLGKDLSHEMIE